MFLKYLLLPFAWLFGLIANARYHIYKWGVCKRSPSPITSIVVGNLKAGGTGKSPMVMFFLDYFTKNGYQVAVLSRGYGRKTKGFLEVKTNLSAWDCGDEPLMIKRNFQHVPVFVCENRVEGLNKIKESHPQVNLVLLDDAFQHFALKADLYVLLTEWSKPFYKDFPLPMGMLREFRFAAKRADLVITTKTPGNLKEKTREEHEKSIRKYTLSTHFYSSINYLEPINFRNNTQITLDEFVVKEIQLVTGIANPRPLLDFLVSKGIRFEHIEFKDHEVITDEKLMYLTQKAVAQKSFILTTEKDFARISPSFIENVQGGDLWHYLPISIEVENKEKLFNLLTKQLPNFATL